MNGELDVYLPFLRDLAQAIGTVISAVIVAAIIQKLRAR